jgi:hypothetical protein
LIRDFESESETRIFYYLYKNGDFELIFVIMRVRFLLFIWLLFVYGDQSMSHKLSLHLFSRAERKYIDEEATAPAEKVLDLTRPRRKIEFLFTPFPIQ